MPEKPQNVSYSLVERYYTAEKLTVIAGLLLIFLQAFGLDNAITLPLLNVRLRDPSKLPLAITVILLLSVTFTWVRVETV